MNKDQPATPFHHAIGRHRRIDAAGNQRNEPATRAHGQPAGAGNFLESEESVARKYFHRDGKLGIGKINPRSGLLFNRGA